MDSMTHSLAILAAAVSISVGAADRAAAPAAQAAPVHAAGCKRVKIQGHRACLAPGKFCTRQWESTYRRYGYTCSFLDRNDRYHLRRLHG
jgi:uncharacterized membrane protein